MWVGCAFCVGVLLAAMHLYYKARMAYWNAHRLCKRSLEAMDKGHLLRVIEDEVKEDREVG